MSKAPTKESEQFVSKKEFDGAVSLILDKFDEMLKAKPPVEESKEEKEVKMAGPNPVQTNPDWDLTAKEILGDYLDHTEVSHDKSGGIKFTVVIKLEKSNAGAAYLESVKTDRRTREVGAAGNEGVIEWCRLIRSNLKRSEAK